ncbi:hypothetical protein DR999_PMT23119 [Platysternon megacephalum]|uniref:Uncharacterized protein n=1 Tax=Platysternon megacephalum TaxID=55544 RepID=A0A4D9DD21_9SAUR|nr:hypothetical protein DR999_PMT23119 [Platysternon megacephalum]
MAGTQPGERRGMTPSGGQHGNRIGRPLVHGTTDISTGQNMAMGKVPEACHSSLRETPHTLPTDIPSTSPPEPPPQPLSQKAPCSPYSLLPQPSPLLLHLYP